MRIAARVLLVVCALQLAACSGVSHKTRLHAADIAERARGSEVGCVASAGVAGVEAAPTAEPVGVAVADVDVAVAAAADTSPSTAVPCAVASPLLAMGGEAMAASTPDAPRHAVVMLDAGQDSLLARVHLIEAAQRTIDLQTFHFERDDAGRLVLDALMDAARRGVHVRLLMDQLSGLDNAHMQAYLAGFHRNFDIRMYNPLFEEAEFGPLQFTAAVLFKFGDLNRRMHNKVMVVDGSVGIVGGRNIQDEYFDWHPEYDYRDRDLLVAGPAAHAMIENFDAFWNDERSLQPAVLGDVASVLVREGVPRTAPMPERSPRVAAMARAAADGETVYARLAPYRSDVGRVDFLADLPSKHDAAEQRRYDASAELLSILASSQSELLLQTPYLVISRPARKLFRDMQARPQPPHVLVSTNSLAATDAFPAYAISHKYKRLYLRELGFEIYEYKPFPLDAPIVAAATGAIGEAPAERAAATAAELIVPWPADPPHVAYPRHAGEAGPPSEPGASVTASPAPTPDAGGFRRLGPVPLKRAGLRIGLHAKSMVIDRRIAIVGSHNFDPRSDDYNTESLVVVHDAAFAERLAQSIERDMAPGNAWVVAPREQLPVLWGLNYNLGKLSEKLPIFDIWPFPYATSYDLRPDAGCTPKSPYDPQFHECYRAVGDFPEVQLTLKGIYTRILTVFGAGLIPIL